MGLGLMVRRRGGSREEAAAIQVCVVCGVCVFCYECWLNAGAVPVVMCAVCVCVC